MPPHVTFICMLVYFTLFCNVSYRKSCAARTRSQRPHFLSFLHRIHWDFEFRTVLFVPRVRRIFWGAHHLLSSSQIMCAQHNTNDECNHLTPSRDKMVAFASHCAHMCIWIQKLKGFVRGWGKDGCNRVVLRTHVYLKGVLSVALCSLRCLKRPVWFSTYFA